MARRRREGTLKVGLDNWAIGSAKARREVDALAAEREEDSWRLSERRSMTVVESGPKRRLRGFTKVVSSDVEGLEGASSSGAERSEEGSSARE